MRKISLPLVFLLALFACTGPIHKAPVSSPPASSAEYTAFVIVPRVNLRSRPSAKAKALATLEDGAELRVRKNEHGWLQVSDTQGNSGYIRSDLLGPRNLSRAKMAAAFNDSIMPRFKAQLFLDKKATYKIVYLTLTEKFYRSKAKARNQAQKIGRAYQQRVYPGAVEIRILQPNTKKIFTRLQLPAIGFAGNQLPVLPFGRIIKWQQNNFQIRIWVAIPANIHQRKLLKTARKISAVYNLPVRKTEIYFVLNQAQVIRSVLTKETALSRPETCILYYLEDKNGEDYHFNFCAPEKTEKSSGPAD